MSFFIPAALLAAAFLPAVSIAGTTPPPLPAAAAPCANCHGTDGHRQGAIPAIAGRPAPLLAGTLRQYRSDSVPDATVMPRLIKGLTDAEIDQIAAYFSAIR